MAAIVKDEPVWEDGYAVNESSGIVPTTIYMPEMEIRSPGKERNVAELERQLATNLTITESRNILATNRETSTTHQNTHLQPAASKAKLLVSSKTGKTSNAQKANMLEKENQHLKHVIEELNIKLTDAKKNYLAEKTVNDALAKVMQGEKPSGSTLDKESVSETPEQSNLTKFLEEKNASLENNVMRLEKELSEALTKSEKQADELCLTRRSVVLLTDKLQSSDQANKAFKKEIEDLNKQIEAAKVNEMSHSQKLNFLEDRLKQTAAMSEEMRVLRNQLEISKSTLALSENTIKELQAVMMNEMREKSNNVALRKELSEVKGKLLKAESALTSMAEKLADHEATKLFAVKLRSDLASLKSSYKSVKEKKKRLKVKALKKCRALQELESKWKGITVFFRKLEEKSAKGQVLSRSDVDAALNYLLSDSLTCDSIHDYDVKKEMDSGDEDNNAENVYLDLSSDEVTAEVSTEINEPVLNDLNVEADSLVQISESGTTSKLQCNKRLLPKHDMEKVVKKFKEVSLTSQKPASDSQVSQLNDKPSMPSNLSISQSHNNNDHEIVIIDSDSDEVIEEKKNSTKTVELRTSMSSTAKVRTRSQIRKSHSVYKLRRSRSVSKPRGIAPSKKSSVPKKCHSRRCRSDSWTSDSTSHSCCHRESCSSSGHDYLLELQKYKLTRQRQQRSRSQSTDSCYSICQKSHSRSGSYHRHGSGRRHRCSGKHRSSKRFCRERQRSRSASRTHTRYPSLSRRRKLHSVCVESVGQRSKKELSKSEGERLRKENSSKKPKNTAQIKCSTVSDTQLLTKRSIESTASSLGKTLEICRTKKNLEDILRERLKEIENDGREDGECSEHGSDPSNEKNHSNTENIATSESVPGGLVSTADIEKNLSNLSVETPQPQQVDDLEVAQTNGNQIDVIPVEEINTINEKTSDVQIEGDLVHPSVLSPNSLPTSFAVPMLPPPPPLPPFPRTSLGTCGSSTFQAPCPIKISIRPDATRSAYLIQNTTTSNVNCGRDSHIPVPQNQSSCEASSSPTYLPHEAEFEAHYPAYFGVNENPNYDWLNSSRLPNQRNNIRINNYMPPRRNKMRNQSRVNSVNIYLPRNHPHIVRRNKKPVNRQNNSPSAVIPLELNVINDVEVDRGIDVVDAIMQKYTVSVVKEIPGYSGKHPIQALAELCETKHWPPPSYTYEAETNTKARELHYFCDVLINNVLYKPKLGSKNKKDAQALAAMYCLQQLGEKP